MKARDLIQQLDPEDGLAWLRVAQDGRLLESGGDLHRFALDDLLAGQSVREQLYYLEGLLPLEGVPVDIMEINRLHEQYMNLYLLPCTDGDWVFFQDVTEPVRVKRLLHQSVNEIQRRQVRNSGGNMHQ